jgi:hypothetical protein
MNDPVDPPTTKEIVLSLSYLLYGVLLFLLIIVALFGLFNAWSAQAVVAAAEGVVSNARR